MTVPLWPLNSWSPIRRGFHLDLENHLETEPKVSVVGFCLLRSWSSKHRLVTLTSKTTYHLSEKSTLLWSHLSIACFCLLILGPHGQVASCGSLKAGLSAFSQNRWRRTSARCRVAWNLKMLYPFSHFLKCFATVSRIQNNNFECYKI